MKHASSSLSWLFAELKRRRVYPVIAAYAVVGWIALQIGEVTFEPLGVPEWVMKALIMLVILGFPVALGLAWTFDITRTGVRRDADGDPEAADQDNRPSIAVLPFTDMSAEKDQGYFCEGVAEEILNALTKIPELDVAARSSSFQYQDGGDVRTIGQELGVKSILEGSVRKSGDHLRITAQLVKVADGYHLWSSTFDEKLADIFSIQDAIAQNIAATLLDKLTPKQQAAIRTTSTSNVSAYDYYLRGRQFLKRFRKMDFEFARDMFHHAITLDREFALAWCGYADCYSLLRMYADRRPSYAAKATAAATRALELAPDLAEAHASCGLAYLICEDFAAAEKEFEEALKLNPRSFEAYYYYARARFHQGDLSGAAEFFKKAADVDPADYQSRCLRVQILRGMGNEKETKKEARSALAVLEKHLAWNPDDIRAFHLGAGTLIALGEFGRAKRWLQRAIEIDPDDSVMLYNVACNFATMNDVDTALDYLAQATERGQVNAAWVRHDTDLSNLRDDPRFRDILERLESREQCAPT